MCGVLFERHLALRDDILKGGPATHRVILTIGRKERVVTDDTYIHAFIFHPYVLPTERPVKKEEY